MVLHLLGKKSWNVYNKDNIERVRRDEAAAAARDEEEEHRMQEEDAVRRTAILRGEIPPPLATPEPESQHESTRNDGFDTGRDRKRRRLRGEDETDQAIRIAREDASMGDTARENLKDKSRIEAPIVDHAGHIQLFAAPDEKQIRKAAKNAEAEAEKAKKNKELEDQYTMRFSNAAGFKNSLDKPWYAKNDAAKGVGDALVVHEELGKDAWGNEDPRRKERDAKRINTSDPMAFMQKAQSQMKQAERDREAWKVQKEKELKELEEMQRRERRREKERRHRHRKEREHGRSLRDGSVDSLEGFALDGREKATKHSHRSRSCESRSRRPRHAHRRRSRSPHR